MMNWLLYLMVWIIKFLYVTIEVILQLHLSIFIKTYLMTSHIPEVQLNQVKTKLRDACEKYCRIKITHKHRKTIENLSKRDDVIILKQDKGRGVVLMDKNKYTEKCMLLLNTKQFKKLDNDPTKTTEGKIQRMLRRIKPKLSEHEYKVLYPSGSSPGKFYGTAKIHKVPRNGNIDQLPIRPIVSNLNTATYQLAKHLSKILSPLRESEYTIKSTRHFMEIIKHKKVPERFQMVSFDVKSLFINVPLETTIDIILRRIYTNHELKTSLTKKEVKELLLLCTKNVHFTFNGQIYIQVDGVAKGYPLAP